MCIPNRYLQISVWIYLSSVQSWKVQIDSIRGKFADLIYPTRQTKLRTTCIALYFPWILSSLKNSLNARIKSEWISPLGIESKHFFFFRTYTCPYLFQVHVRIDFHFHWSVIFEEKRLFFLNIEFLWLTSIRMFENFKRTSKLRLQNIRNYWKIHKIHWIILDFIYKTYVSMNLGKFRRTHSK